MRAPDFQSLVDLYLPKTAGCKIHDVPVSEMSGDEARAFLVWMVERHLDRMQSYPYKYSVSLRR